MIIGRFEKDVFIKMSKEEYIDTLTRCNKFLDEWNKYDIDEVVNSNIEEPIFIWERSLDITDNGFMMNSEDFWDIIRECTPDEYMNNEKDFEIEIGTEKEKIQCNCT